jgi:hypothetical protein
MWGGVSMRKPRAVSQAVSLCGCLAALPLLTGCANGVGRPPQAYALPVPATETAPAAVLVVLPDPGGILAADPLLLAAQGFDAVAPSPSMMYRIAAAQEQAAARLVAQMQALVRAMADGPVWPAGPNPAVEAAMAPGEPGQMSGMVVTSMTSGAGSCSERMTYSYSGNGAPPKVSVSKSGSACPAGSPFGDGANSTPAPAAPAAPAVPTKPRLIEASAPAGNAPASAPQSAVQRLADVVKASPPG